MIEKQREELRRRVSEIQSRKPTRRRYPEELRQAVCSYMRERLCRGGRSRRGRCRMICLELFLSPATVKRWLREHPPEAPPQRQAGLFRTVALVREEPRARAGHVFGSASCSLTTPAGYRVDGLAVEQIVYVLRELS